MKRAIDEKQKNIKRQRILDSALHLFESSGGYLSTVEAIARHAGIAKGTVYLYFQTRDQIYLTLLEDYINNWFDAIVSGINKDPVTLFDIINLTGLYIDENPSFMRLSSIFNGILEKNIDYEIAYGFKLHLKERVYQTGNLIAEVFYISEELAIRLILRSFGLCIGLWQIAEPAPVLKQIHADRDLGLMKIDFSSEIKAALLNLWEGALKKDVS